VGDQREFPGGEGSYSALRGARRRREEGGWGLKSRFRLRPNSVQEPLPITRMFPVPRAAPAPPTWPRAFGRRNLSAELRRSQARRASMLWPRRNHLNVIGHAPGGRIPVGAARG